MKNVDLMIFDFDGTIADTGRDLVSSVNHTLTMLNLTPKPQEEIISFVGDGVMKLIERALGEENKTDLHKALEIFIRHYEEHMLDTTVLYPHTESVLQHYSNKKKVILTNKRYHLALDIARGLGIDQYFLEIVGADSTPFVKPDPRVVEYLLSKYAVEKSHTVIIGDGANDVAVAKNSGILSCALLNGLGYKEKLIKMGADYYCENLLEINDLFQ